MRFITRPPTRTTRTVEYDSNVYEYVRDNPVEFVDPLGLIRSLPYVMEGGGRGPWPHSLEWYRDNSPPPDPSLGNQFLGWLRQWIYQKPKSTGNQGRDGCFLIRLPGGVAGPRG